MSLQTTLPSAVHWQVSLAKAQSRAVNEGLPVLMDFSAAPDCKGCVAMDSTTFADRRVSEMIECLTSAVRIKTKQNPVLVREFVVTWTPNVLVTDPLGRVHYRIEGFMQPEDFMSYLAIGVGKFSLANSRFAEAESRFEDVIDHHPHTDACAEALFWLGVSRYKETHDWPQARKIWDHLIDEYRDTTWAKRAQIPTPEELH